MQLTTLAAFVAAFAAGASAHMEMIDPPPFRGKTNKLVSNPDFNMVAPLENGGFPCKGYHKDFGTPAGGSTKTYAAGQQTTFQLTGIAAAHSGGSCQASLSFDQGKTWKVIKSYIGNCVRSLGGNTMDPNQTYSFTIPADAKAGDAIFGWTWFNDTGNREMYMNCAHITITGSGTSTLSDAPDTFVANVGNGCATVASTDVAFPNPGKDVEKNPAKGNQPTGAPTGNCAGGGSGSGGPGPAPAPAKGAPAPAPAAGGSHTVAAGDNCDAIAKASGVSITVLLAANPTVNAGCTNLQVGQVLHLRRRSRIMRRYV